MAKKENTSKVVIIPRPTGSTTTQQADTLSKCSPVQSDPKAEEEILIPKEEKTKAEEETKKEK